MQLKAPISNSFLLMLAGICFEVKKIEYITYMLHKVMEPGKSKKNNNNNKCIIS